MSFGGNMVRFAVLALSLALMPLSTAEAANKKAQPKAAARAPARAPAKAAAKAAPAAKAKAPARAVASTRAPAKAAPAAKNDTSYKVRMPAAAAFIPNADRGGMASIGGVAESDKAIQVTGQSRNLSMLLTLRNEKDRIKFVEVRRDFRPEIGQTQY